MFPLKGVPQSHSVNSNSRQYANPLRLELMYRSAMKMVNTGHYRFMEVLATVGVWTRKEESYPERVGRQLNQGPTAHEIGGTVVVIIRQLNLTPLQSMPGVNFGYKH
jgi:hypothetical protein